MLDRIVREYDLYILARVIEIVRNNTKADVDAMRLCGIAQDFLHELQQLNYNDVPIRGMLLSSDQLEALDPATNVLYITPGNAALLDSLASLANARQIFSVTGVPEYVEKQSIALGFSEYQGKPQIVLCLPAARAAGHNFQHPNFLNLQTTRKLRLIK
jgi:hypothetical protein